MNDFDTTLTGHDLTNVDWVAAARRMRFLIETNHMTVPDVAHDLGIKQVTLQEILDGDARASEYLIVAAANYFGVTVDFLVSDQSSPGEAPSASNRRSSSSSRSRRRESDRSEPSRSRRPAAAAGLSMADLAVRHQALVELLIEKGAITATEYNAAVHKIEERTRG